MIQLIPSWSYLVDRNIQPTILDEDMKILSLIL
ncbi:glycosyl hydrolase family protein [Clostridium botulinum CFSAN002367]|nr:glycosyl hydrolase family protein [Clostridium botulinum CFSAN002367]EPS49067.1 glycosyl hydrolase family protein [Clostridium botulinum CFSAN002369]